MTPRCDRTARRAGRRSSRDLCGDLSRDLSRAVASAALLVALLATVGCVGLPEAGPVTVPGDQPAGAGSPGVDYVPPGPTAGESPAEIVQHFLGAMRATSYQTRVARQFLTVEAAETWSPGSRTIVYDAVSRPESGARVTVDLTGAAEIDAQGRWKGSVTSSARQVSFGLAEENGEWRIASLPDALIVPLTWFEARYESTNVYFLDPSERILVPTPVYLASGEQLPTRLVAALLQGPGADFAGAATSAFGATDAPGLSVDVSAAGQATIRMTTSDDGAQMPSTLTEPMVAQLAWTLRQVPSIARVQVRVDDVPVPTPDGEDTFGVTAGQRYAPDVIGADTSLYGIADSAVVNATDTTPVAGAEVLGQAGVTSLALSVSGRRVVGQSGDELLIVGLDDPAAPPIRIPTVGTTQVSSDFADRLWVLDGGEQARVRTLTQGSAEVVEVPGVSGQQVRRLMISRDGSRLVALVGPEGSQRVVTSWVRYDERGGVSEVVGQPVPLAVPVSAGQVVLDVAWRAPTEVVVLSRLSGGLTQVQVASIDGSPASGGASDVLISSAERLVSSPVPGSQVLLVGPEGVEEFDGTSTRPFAAANGVGALTYTG